MDESRRKHLARYDRALRSILRQIDDLIERKWQYVPEETFIQMSEEIFSAVNDLPDVMPTYDEARLRKDSYFKPEAIRAYLGRALAAIETELEDAPRGEVIGPTLVFPFIADTKLRAIVERDYPELLTAFSASCKKSCLILSGGIIETMLLDFLIQNGSAAAAATAAPREPDPKKWTFEQLIDVAVELKPSLAPVRTMSHTVRQYRNLVHPAVELKSSMMVEIEEARVSISVLQIIHRELSKP